MDVSKLYAKVEEAHKKKNFDFAIEILKNQLLKFNPNDVKARQLLRGTVLKKHEVYGKPSPIKTLSKALVPLIKLMIGKMGKKWDVVMDEAENYLQYDPKNATILHMLGDACVKAGYVDAGISVFENIMAFNPNHSGTFKALGYVHFNRKATMDVLTQKEEIKKTLEDAKRHFDRAATLAPMDTEAIKMSKDISAQLTSLIYEDAKSSQDLIKDKDKTADQEKDNAILRTDDDVLAAIEVCKKRLAENQQNKKELRRLSELYLKLLRYDEAMQILEKLTQLDPTSFDIKSKISECKVLKAEAKIQALQEKLKKSPQDAKLKQELQKAVQTKSEVEIQEYELQIKAQPTNYEVRYKLGVALFQIDKIDEAIGNLQHAIKDPKYKINAYSYMGQAFTKKKEYDMAIEQFKSLLGILNPKENMYRDTLYNMGVSYESAKRYPEAMEVFMTIYKADIGFKDIQAKVKKLRELTGAK